MQTQTLIMLPASALSIDGIANHPLNLNLSLPLEGQVKAYLKSLGNEALGKKRVVLTGQPVAAILTLPGLEMLGGLSSLPNLALIPYGKTEVVDWVNLADFRHNVVRSRRAEIPGGEAFAGYTVLDGAGRGLTAGQLTELAQKLDVKETDIRTIGVAMGQVDLTSAAAATAGMVDKLLSTGLTTADWTGGRVLFLPGGAGIVAALQATAIHGLSESWPQTIRLNAGADRVFHVEAVENPQAMRQWAVGLAREMEAAKPVVSLSGTVPEEFRTALEELAKTYGVTIRG